MFTQSQPVCFPISFVPFNLFKSVGNNVFFFNGEIAFKAPPVFKYRLLYTVKIYKNHFEMSKRWFAMLAR